MNGVQTRLKCKPNVKRCKRFVFAAHSPLLHPNTLTTKAISHFQADHILTRFVFPPLRALKWKKEEKAELLLIAVRPDYQGLGVNALFFDDLIPVYNERHFKWAETGPQLEDNVKELTQWKPLHPTLTKRRRCYKKKL